MRPSSPRREVSLAAIARSAGRFYHGGSPRMPDPIPTDDLYARLGVPADADTPAIDRAWRGLLKRHHPDVAGSLSLELAKLINVAHDWLSRPDRRARYDATIRVREGHRTSGGRPTPGRPAARHRDAPSPLHTAAPGATARRRRPPP